MGERKKNKKEIRFKWFGPLTYLYCEKAKPMKHACILNGAMRKL